MRTVRNEAGVEYWGESERLGERVGRGLHNESVCPVVALLKDIVSSVSLLTLVCILARLAGLAFTSL